MSGDQTVCAYAKLDNGVHQMTIAESSRRAVDAMVTYIYEALAVTPQGQPALYLIDNTGAPALPLKYTAQRIKEVDTARPDDRPPGRVALLYDGVIVHLANALLSIAMKNELRFFKSENRDDAIAWLLDIQ